MAALLLVKQPNTRAQSHTIIGAIHSSGAVHVVYISQNENSSRFTPIVINIREVVDSDSMSDTILLSTLVYEKYKISPIVLIIPSTPINREELGINEDTFLIPFKSTF